MLLVEQELFMRSQPIGFLPIFSAVHDAQYLVLCVLFYRSLLVSLPVSYWSLYYLTAIDLCHLIVPVEYSTFCLTVTYLKLSLFENVVLD